jgi:hypothetical protein
MSEHKIDLSRLAKIKDGTSHSIFGPSGSPTYLHCAGSLIPNLLAPDDAGEDAAYGTVAHSVTEIWGKTGKKPKYLLGQTRKITNAGVEYEIEIDADMFVHVRACIDWVQFLPGEHFHEVKIDFSDLTPIPRQTGTADFVAVTHGRMIVVDWKFGKGYMVYAEKNSQLLLYAYGVFVRFGIDYDIEEIEIRIAQPRLDHFDTWVVSRAELMEFAKWAKERMAAAWVINAPRTPGELQCKWCKVRTTCTANLKMQSDLMLAVFDDIGKPVTEDMMLELKENIEFEELFEPVNAVTLSTSDMAFILKFRRTVEAWWKSLANELLRRAGAGEKIPHWKLVESRSHKKFVDEKKALKILMDKGAKRDEIIKETFVTPAEAERVLKRHGVPTKDLPKLLAPLVYKPTGKPSLAGLSDKRPAIEDLSDIAFRDLAFENPENEEL